MYIDRHGAPELFEMDIEASNDKTEVTFGEIRLRADKAEEYFIMSNADTSSVETKILIESRLDRFENSYNYMEVILDSNEFLDKIVYRTRSD